MTGAGKFRLPGFGLLAVLAVSVWMLLGGAIASANTITVGSVLPPGPTSKPVGEIDTFLNTALPEKGANLTSPVSGVVVRWRLQGAKGGPFYLRVLSPNGLGAYTAQGKSDPATVTSPGLQTFNTNLRIRAGDVLGVEPTNAADELGYSTAAGAAFTTIFPTPFEGATVPARAPTSGEEIELSAEIQPTPAVIGVSPGSGSVTGGTVVKITGSDFTSASAVKFGEDTAATFKVESDSEIVATAPRSAKVNTIDITVTTLAGTSPTVRADHFSYQGCVVPKLKKKKLGKAKQLITRAGCKVGKVTKKHGVTAQTGKVVHQGPAAGKVVARGTKVKVKLG
jgi:PASTA domain/IPT/TIG domain